MPRVLNISKDFSPNPGPRKKIEGEWSGELFRETVLLPAIQSAIVDNEKLLVDLDNTEGFGTSFLEESFGGLIRIDKLEFEKIDATLEYKSEEEDFLIDDIKQYLEDAFRALK